MSQNLHQESAAGCGDGGARAQDAAIVQKFSLGGAQPFDFDACEDGHEKEWRAIKHDVRIKATLLRCIWRGKGGKDLPSGSDESLRGKEYEKTIGKPLNIVGIMRCDMLVWFTAVAVIYFCLATYLLIFNLSETNGSQFVIPSFFSLSDARQQLVLSSAVIVWAASFVFILTVFMPWTILLHDRREKYVGKATEAIRDYFQTDVLGEWVDEMRHARERLSFGAPGNIPQASADNAYRAISIWRRLERFSDKTLLPFRHVQNEQSEVRWIIYGIVATIFLFTPIYYAGYLFLEIQNRGMDYDIAQQLMIVFATCYCAAFLAVIVFRIILRQQADKAVADLQTALTGEPLFSSKGSISDDQLSALEKTIAKLDPFCLLVGRYQAALDAAERKK